MHRAKGAAEVEKGTRCSSQRERLEDTRDGVGCRVVGESRRGVKRERRRELRKGLTIDRCVSFLSCRSPTEVILASQVSLPELANRAYLGLETRTRCAPLLALKDRRSSRFEAWKARKTAG